MRGEQLPTPDPVDGLPNLRNEDLIRCRVTRPAGPEQPCKCPPGDCARERPFTRTEPEPAPVGGLADTERAIARVEASRLSHQLWIDYLDRNPDYPLPEFIQTRDEHQQIVDEYDNVLAVLAAREQGRADLAAKVEAVAALLCERHQYSSPTRQPCAACSQDARAVLTDPTEPCAEFGEHPRGGHADAVRRASDG